MASYKIIGQRILRKYTEPKKSPTYSASIEAQTIVDSLCAVPWEKVAARDATMTYHTEENVGTDENKISGLDMNVQIRDQFDAALFCADHTGGQHRAYANAAVYHYVFPDGTLPKLTKLTAKVTSDPYNSAGARIAILTNATGEIPTNCNACRTGDAHADGVAPRTVADNGNWFPTMADCVFSANPGDGETALPAAGLQLQKHLFVFVLMESYSTVRGNWLEGCSYIRNLVEIETNAAVTGWTDGDTYDLYPSADIVELPILTDGVMPDVTGEESSVVSIALTAGGTLPEFDDVGKLIDAQTIRDEMSPSNSVAGVRGVYAKLLTGSLVPSSKALANPNSKRYGFGFAVKQGAAIEIVDGEGNVYAPRMISMTAAALIVPFSVPDGLSPNRVTVDFSSWKSGRAIPEGMLFNVWVKDGAYLCSYDHEVLVNHSIYDCSSKEVGGWMLVGRIDAHESSGGSLALPKLGGRVGSILFTAFMPQGSVPVTDDEFLVGSGNIWYDGITPEDRVGLSADIYPLYRNDREYHVGDRVSVFSSMTGFKSTDICSAAHAFANSDGSVFVCTKADDLRVYFSHDRDKLEVSGLPFGSYYIMCVDDVFFAKASGGAVYVSEDGETWVETNLPTSVSVDSSSKIRRLGSLFYDYSMNYASADGETWVETNLSSYSMKNQAVYLNGVYVVQVDAFIVYSNDGITFENTRNGPGAGGNLIVAGEYIYRSHDGCMATKDGYNWTSIGKPLSSVVYVDGYYFGYALIGAATSGVCYSSDGVNFSLTNLIGYNYSVGMSAGHMVAAAGGVCYVYTGDPAVLTQCSGIGFLPSGAIGFNGGFVCFSNNGVSVDVYLSEDFVVWEKVQLEDAMRRYVVKDGIAYGIFNDEDGSLKMSYDGRNWEIVGSGYSDFVFTTLGNVTFIRKNVQGGTTVILQEDWSNKIAYVCVVDSTGPGMINRSDWKIESNPVKGRFHGFDDLCVPDVKLIC